MATSQPPTASMDHHRVILGLMEAGSLDSGRGPSDSAPISRQPEGRTQTTLLFDLRSASSFLVLLSRRFCLRSLAATFLVLLPPLSLFAIVSSMSAAAMTALPHPRSLMVLVAQNLKNPLAD